MSHLLHAGRSECGPRQQNQDFFAIEPEIGLFVVADGMGGHRAGEVASRLAVETLVAFVRATAQGPDQTWPFPYDPDRSVAANRMIAGMRLANRRVHEEGSSEVQFAGMGTTMVAALVEDGRIVIAHVGDSRAYLLRGGHLEAKTRDHTWIAAMLAAEPNTRADDHPMRHVLTNGIGMRDDVTPAVTEEELDSGDCWLLCSDGVHGYATEETLAAALGLSSPEAAAARVVQAALDTGGTDNATAIVLRFV